MFAKTNQQTRKPNRSKRGGKFTYRRGSFRNRPQRLQNTKLRGVDTYEAFADTVCELLNTFQSTDDIAYAALNDKLYKLGRELSIHFKTVCEVNEGDSQAYIYDSTPALPGMAGQLLGKVAPATPGWAAITGQPMFTKFSVAIGGNQLPPGKKYLTKHITIIANCDRDEVLAKNAFARICRGVIFEIVLNSDKTKFVCNPVCISIRETFPTINTNAIIGPTIVRTIETNPPVKLATEFLIRETSTDTAVLSPRPVYKMLKINGPDWSDDDDSGSSGPNTPPTLEESAQADSDSTVINAINKLDKLNLNECRPIDSTSSSPISPSPLGVSASELSVSESAMPTLTLPEVVRVIKSTPTYKVYPMLDGTVINLYYSSGEWHISTRKIPIADKVVWREMSYGEAFYSMFDKNLLDDLDENYTYNWCFTHPAHHPFSNRSELFLLGSAKYEDGQVIRVSADQTQENIPSLEQYMIQEPLYELCNGKFNTRVEYAEMMPAGPVAGEMVIRAPVITEVDANVVWDRCHNAIDEFRANPKHKFYGYVFRCDDGSAPDWLVFSDLYRIVKELLYDVKPYMKDINIVDASYYFHETNYCILCNFVMAGNVKTMIEFMPHMIERVRSVINATKEIVIEVYRYIVNMGTEFENQRCENVFIRPLIELLATSISKDYHITDAVRRDEKNIPITDGDSNGCQVIRELCFMPLNINIIYKYLMV